MKIDLEKYSREGVLLLDTPLRNTMIELRKIFVQVFDLIATPHGLGPIRDDQDIDRLYRGDSRHLWVAAYDQLSFLPETMALCNEPCFFAALEELGFTRPSLPFRSVIRGDMPSDDKWNIDSHQDYVYHYGSNNAVTFWLPFQDTDVALGAMQVARGTHLNGARPQVNGILKDVDRQEFESVPTKAGQALLFNQFLFHRSGPNRTNRIRFSVQIRYNDLGAPDYQRRQFYLNWDDQSKTKEDPWFETAFVPPSKKTTLKA